MNEVTRIHLGRQSFMISVEAHKELKAYLASIEKVTSKEVSEEVEARMSELLLERGVSGDKTVLPKDVNFLKEQLGQPADFSDEDEAEVNSKSEASPRRLFRDTDNALIAGVAAGLANYFGVDVVLVRVVMAALVFFGGSGIVLYLILWLVVPPAVTTSEKLQMRGLPVNLEALKDSVSKADVVGTARRVNNSLFSVIDWLFRACVKLLGLGLIAFGLFVFFGTVFVKIYMLLHSGKLFQENLFPVGGREELLVAIVMVLGVIASIFLMLTGVAALKRKWPVRGWLTAVLVGLFLLGFVAASALAADAAPRVRDRYESSRHTTAIKNIQPFSKVDTSGDVDIEYIASPNYAVNVQYVGNPDLSKLKVNVSNDTLYVNSTALDQNNHCTMLCLYPRYDMVVDIYAPNIQDFKTPAGTEKFFPDVPPVPVNTN